MIGYLEYWLVVEPYPSEKYEFVSWDDDIPNIWKKKVPNHQPDFYYVYNPFLDIKGHPTFAPYPYRCTNS